MANGQLVLASDSEVSLWAIVTSNWLLPAAYY